ncbi:MAG: glycosyltransferase family 2 protein [Phycisphaerales bacterium JB039]
MRLAVIIPVYNERDLLPALIERVDAAALPEGVTARTLVVVDDGSTDGTAEIVAALDGRDDVRTIRREVNRGKGASVRSGLAAALEAGADLVIIQDADLEYDPREHAVVCAPILDGRADAVIGSRFIGQTHRVLYFWHYVANRAITLLSNAVTNLNLTDIECCFKAFSREVAEHLDLKEERFGIEPEMVAKVARLRLPASGGVRPARIYETAVSYAGRTYAEGKKIGWRDGISAVRCIVKYGLLG